MDEPGRTRSERHEMVRQQLAARAITDPRVLAAMEAVPRHLFVPPESRHLAYQDSPLAIGEGQTISQPYIVALMTQLLQLDGSERVLEVGTGSGYQAAILGELAREVCTIERFESLAGRARKVLADLGCNNVRVFVGDGSLGLPEYAPFNAVILTAAAPRIPRLLAEQLADGGRMVVPVGGRRGQLLQLVLRRGDRFLRKKLVPVAFVPLRGSLGWREDEWR